MLDKEDKEILIYNYRAIKESREIFDSVISEQEFIANIKTIDRLKKDFWETTDSHLEELIQIADFKFELVVEKKIDDSKIYLKDIVGTWSHSSYCWIPWIMAVPLLKRFQNNFPKTLKDREELFSKMRKNEFYDKLKVVKFKNNYYILEGHNRIIISKALGLDYITAQVYEEVKGKDLE